MFLLKLIFTKKHKYINDKNDTTVIAFEVEGREDLRSVNASRQSEIHCYYVPKYTN